jgi:hypothetical protein
MKEDAAAKELEDLLRDALNAGLEPPRGATPLMQLKTVPLQVQHIPMKPAAAPKPPPVETAPDSITGLADKLAPESIPPPAPSRTATTKRSRSSLVALVTVGTIALAAAGGAVWLSHERHAPIASAGTTAAMQTSNDTPATEGAVGIPVAARPAETSTPAPTPTEGAKIGDGKPTTTGAATLAVAAASTPVSAKADKLDAKPELKDAKENKAETKPKHSPASAKTEAKAEKTTTVEKKEAAQPPAPPPPPPAPAAGGVDALLQQQLKGAIP